MRQTPAWRRLGAPQTHPANRHQIENRWFDQPLRALIHCGSSSIAGMYNGDSPIQYSPFKDCQKSLTVPFVTAPFVPHSQLPICTRISRAMKVLATWPSKCYCSINRCANTIAGEPPGFQMRTSAFRFAAAHGDAAVGGLGESCNSGSRMETT